MRDSPRNEQARGYQPRTASCEEIVTLRGLPHRVLQFGPPKGRPIFLLHGVQDCADTFQLLVDALPNDWRFIALDWRGFGNSAQQRAPYWFPDYLADLEALLECYAKDQPAILLGHSMGGNIAGLYAGIRPQRCAALISLEGFGLQRTAAEQAPERYASWLDAVAQQPRDPVYDSPDSLADVLRRRNPRLTPEIASFIARSWTRQEDEGFRLRFDPYHRLVNPVLYRREEAEACWRRVGAPVLLLLGGESPYRQRLEPSGDLQRFQQCFATLETKDFPALGHMLHHEDPAAVAEVVRSWLCKQFPEEFR
jgi:pimeloyl-ACP methyl ester carboxylesterase